MTFQVIKGLSESFLVWCPDHFPLTQPLNSHEWPRQNFSLKYQYDINQISDENKEKDQFEDN